MGEASSRTDWYLESLTTPTTSMGGPGFVPSSPFRNVLPIGFRLGKKRWARVWLTITTAGEVLVSLPLKLRPARRVMRSVPKYPGEMKLKQTREEAPVTALDHSV